MDILCRNSREPWSPRTDAILAPAEEKVERQVLMRFELCQQLGKGAYGIVWKVVEKHSRKIIVLKKCFDAFRSPGDAQRM